MEVTSQYSARRFDARANATQHLPARADEEPGLIEGGLLVMTCWCTVLASGLLSPVLPQIAQRFAGNSHVDLLVGLVATMPALAVSLAAIPVGWLGDRFGHRKLLFAALLMYGVAGVTPFWLDDIWPIIGARALVGLGEAGAMVAGTALVGLRFCGARRGRWLAAQIATSNILGIFALQFGGLLGLHGWHTPYLAYEFALLLLAPSLYFIKAPVSVAKKTANAAAQLPGTKGAAKATAILCGIQVAAISGMFAIVIQMAFLFQQRGAVNSADIGLGISCGAIGLAAGATSSGALVRIDWLRRTTTGFVLAGIGFLGVAVVSGYWATGAAIALAGLGIGLIVPALLNALVAVVPANALGSVIGIWTAATFIAQFLNPPIFVFLRHVTGTQSLAMGSVGAFLLALGLSLRRLRAGRAAAMNVIASSID
jgi:predicted MFS family arabinose efflux permease